MVTKMDPGPPETSRVRGPVCGMLPPFLVLRGHVHKISFTMSQDRLAWPCS